MGNTITKETIIVSYTTSVFTQGAGWRSVDVVARAEKTSPKKCRIIEVLDVDGNGTCGYASRTGANRQKYSVDSVVRKEEGKNKIISKLTVEKD